MSLIDFYLWADEAATLVEDATLNKQDALDENPDQQLPEIFWEAFSHE